MKVAKKIIVGVLAIGIIFLLCGCGGESWKKGYKKIGTPIWTEVLTEK